MSRRERKEHRQRYLSRVADRYTPERLSENLLWAVLRPLEAKRALSITRRRQFKQALDAALSPEALTAAADGEIAARIGLTLVPHGFSVRV